MMPFSTGTGLERMGVVGLDQDRWWVELEDAGSPRYSRMAAMLICGLRLKHLSAKTRKKGGRRGLGPWPLRCLSQILSERKERMLRLLSIGVQLLRTFYCWGWPCIYNVYCSQFEGYKDSFLLDDISCLYRMRY